MNALRTPPQAPLRLVATCVPAAPAPAGVPGLPLIHRPGRVALVAEDPALVDALSRSLPRRWRVLPFVSATRALYALQQQQPAWQADLWAQQDILARWRAGAALLPLVLHDWASRPGRRALATVAVADGCMTGLDGLDLFDDLQGWSGWRVLMAGARDVGTAREALAQDRIDRLVVKRDHSLRADLAHAVDGLLARPTPSLESLWANALRPAQLALLGRPGVAGDLHELLRTHCVEWTVLAEPFGVLGLDAGGGVHWLQLEDPAGLPDLALRAGRAGLGPAALEGVRSGRQLANVDLRACLGLPGADLLAARQLGGPRGLLAAATRVDLTSGRRAPAALPCRPAAARRSGLALPSVLRDLFLVPAAG